LWKPLAYWRKQERSRRDPGTEARPVFGEVKPASKFKR
jgi:hypothetical protein